MIKEISLLSYRNFRAHKFVFDSGINLILGPNGSGKTNLLEAIGYLSQAKSFRRVPDRNLIAWGETFFRIEAIFEKDGLNHNIAIFYDSETETKKISINNKVVERATILFSTLPSLISSDRDQDIIDGPPRERRRIINRLISITSSEYMRLIQDYSKVLENKNFLLRNKKVDEIKPWNQKQQQLSIEIVRHRKKFMEKIKDHFLTLSQEFLKGKKAQVTYVPSADEETSFDSFIKEELERGHSFHGPHRDSIEFLIEGKPAKIYASEGEKRLIILAFYFTFLNIYNPNSMVILDEPFSVLDKRGVELVLSHLNTQSFISAPYFDLESSKISKVIEL
uniref:DNA replication and repair protein RecF n=1 Tax=candidate division WOR-3 bacterium TaxID=2052148 RepID=A0A7C2K2Z0_UNCW3